MRLFLKTSPKIAAQMEILDKRLEEAFLNFIPKYEKNYKDQQEYFHRRAIFQENYKKILEHDPQKEGFTIDVNGFSDWTEEEFNGLFGTKFLDLDPEDLKVHYDPNDRFELE